jgi:hypothetical protein
VVSLSIRVVGKVFEYVLLAGAVDFEIVGGLTLIVVPT